MPALAPAKAARIRAAIARARARGHTPRPPTPIRHPEAAARAYITRLRTLVSERILAAYLPVLADLPTFVAQARQERGDAAEWRADGSGAGRVASAAVRAAAAGSAIPRDKVAGAAKAAAGDVGAHVQAGLGRQVKEVLGIDLMADPRAKARVAAFVHENVKLIVGITPKLAGEVEAIILAGLTSGQLHETMALAIKSRMKIAIDRAELIARDQVGKIFGQVASARAQDLGATHFFWQTAEDERVRGNPAGRYPKAKPSHFDRNRRRYAYADPPKGKNGEPELPGVPINCRCVGQPDLTTVPGMEGVAEEVAAMPTPAGGVETTEEEAARLMAEVEAMMAGMTKPGRAPLGTVSAPAPVPPPAAAPVAAAPVAAAPPTTPGVEDVRAAVAAVDAEAQRPMATAPPPGVTYSQQAIDGREAFEAGLLTDLGKPVTLDEIAHAYAPPPGLTAHIDRAIAGGVDITYKNAAGEVVATMSREFRAGGVVYHASLEVAEKFRGSGIANELNGAALLRYKKMGITSIELDAAWIGRYAWASAGFDLDPDSKARVLAAALRFVDENVPSDRREAYRAKVTALIENPSDLARWDDGDRYSVVVDTGDAKERGDHPIGKAILLHHKMPTWSGAMRLDESNPGYRRALQVYGVAARVAKAAPSTPAAAAAPPAPAPTARSPRRPDQAVEALAKLLPGDASAWQDRLRAISRTKPHDE